MVFYLETYDFLAFFRQFQPKNCEKFNKNFQKLLVSFRMLFL